VPLAGILPTRIAKSLTTDVETLAKRMLDEGRAARPGVRVITGKDI